MARPGDGEALQLEDLRERFQDVGVVVHDQYAPGHVRDLCQTCALPAHASSLR